MQKMPNLQLITLAVPFPAQFHPRALLAPDHQSKKPIETSDLLPLVESLARPLNPLSVFDVDSLATYVGRIRTRGSSVQIGAG